MSDSIELTVKVMPSGDEVSIELDCYTSGKEIKKELINEGIAPSTDNEGNPIVYKLISQIKNKVIGDHKTLDDLDIKSGETLFMNPDLVAGACL